jgi:hypothetical protein
VGLRSPKRRVKEENPRFGVGLAGGIALLEAGLHEAHDPLRVGDERGRHRRRAVRGRDVRLVLRHVGLQHVLGIRVGQIDRISNSSRCADFRPRW